MPVDEFIAGQRLKLAFYTPPGHLDRPRNLILLGCELLSLFLESKSPKVLEEAIQYGSEALAARPLPDPLELHSLALNLLGSCLSERFKTQDSIADLNESATCHLRALALRPEGHLERGVTLNSLGEVYQLLFQKFGRTEDLVKSLVYSRGGLTACPPGHFDRLTSLMNVAISSCSRFEKFRQGHDIADATDFTQQALWLAPPGNENRYWVLESHTSHLSMLYRHFGQRHHLDDAERFCRELVRLSVGDSDHASASHNLASHLLTRFESHNDLTILEEAISLGERGLRSRPSGHRLRHLTLELLAIATRLRFEQRAQDADIRCAVAYGQEALSLAIHPRDTSRVLHGLGISHLMLFQSWGRIDDLHKSMQYSQEALRLNPHGAYLTLVNMVEIYRHRFHRLQDENDLVEATQCGLRALQMSPETEPGRFITLNNLVGVKCDRFEFSGNVEYLEEAIAYCRQAFPLCPTGHSMKGLLYINLALLLSARLQHLGEKSDMEDSILAGEKALSLFIPGHPRRPRCLEIMVVCLQKCWVHSQDVTHLDKAVEYSREALPLHSPGNLDHSKSRQYLATALFSRFLQKQNKKDIEEAILFYQESLSSCAEESSDYPIFLANLAAALSTRFDTSGDSADLNDSIIHYSKATRLCKVGHPLQATVEYGFALTYLKVTPLTEAIAVKAFSLFESASHHPSASVHTKFEAAFKWSFAARKHRHKSTIPAFSTLLALLETRLLLKPTIESQRDFLRRIPFRMLSCDAASAAIDAGRLDIAVELLEQGRTMMWSRMRGYRHPINALREVNETLAEQFQAVSNRLERSALALEPESILFSSATLSGSSSHQPRLTVDSQMGAHRILSEEWTRILNQIRSMEGFADFLRPLQHAAVEGPVILVNVSAPRCDALIISNSHSPILVPLPLCSPDILDDLCGQLLSALASTPERRPKKLVLILRELWRTVVAPIVDELVSLGIKINSRIWWCPTGQLCALPLHAAGPFSAGQRNLPDIFVSSYTPTLAALISARSGALPPSVPRLLVIGQSETLPSVADEVNYIEQMGDFVDVLVDSDATGKAVLSNLLTHTWAHFACHAHRHAEPFKSAFELFNGDRLTPLDIASARLPHAEFAFLSACHSAAPDFGGTPDEFINLAAALQFSGFRGVVSTLWAMADEDGVQVAQDFYSHILRPGSAPSVKDAAVALNATTRLMRKRGIPLDRWVNFIHIGI
ncbi:CHAT domain-containing protein [Mycena rebaudengoi]|nr:CHAT domain-containing protein [Mycena rebaudengoi]